jgi:hypothetical protein
VWRQAGGRRVSHVAPNSRSLSISSISPSSHARRVYFAPNQSGDVRFGVELGLARALSAERKLEVALELRRLGVGAHGPRDPRAASRSASRGMSSTNGTS